MRQREAAVNLGFVFVLGREEGDEVFLRFELHRVRVAQGGGASEEGVVDFLQRRRDARDELFARGEALLFMPTVAPRYGQRSFF